MKPRCDPSRMDVSVSTSKPGNKQDRLQGLQMANCLVREGPLRPSDGADLTDSGFALTYTLYSIEECFGLTQLHEAEVELSKLCYSPPDGNCEIMLALVGHKEEFLPELLALFGDFNCGEGDGVELLCSLYLSAPVTSVDTVFLKTSSEQFVPLWVSSDDKDDESIFWGEVHPALRFELSDALFRLVQDGKVTRGFWLIGGLSVE